MSIFTDVDAAIDEAVWCAEQTDRAQAIVTLGNSYTVLPQYEARYQRMRILEVVHPLEEAA